MFREMEKRNENNEPIKPPNMEKESQGHQAEGIVIEFLRANYNMGFSNMERTSTFDQNDMNGIDAAGTIEGDGRVAIDITFNDDPEVLKRKMKRNINNPCTPLRDERGGIISERLPRILLRDVSTANWIQYSKDAAKHGITLLEEIKKDPFKRKKEVQFLKAILQQIDGLSTLSNEYKYREYRQKIEPAKKIFEEKLKEIAA
jgi:hypothetical protein